MVGFVIIDFVNWFLFLFILLIFLSFIGGCVGLIGGGLKVIWVYLLFLQGKCEIDWFIYFKVVYFVKLGEWVMLDCVVEVVWGFFLVYVIVFVVIMIGLIVIGLDNIMVFMVIVVILNNLGLGLGFVVGIFVDVSDGGKWLLVVVMLFGCLEIFLLLVLFLFIFW